MTTFVLLHGAFHGAWCWSRVAPLLRAAGHQVFTPTQTGLGDRAHLLHAGITLTTFVDDLVAVLDTEELTDAVLVGHSFGGAAITGAAERVPHRIRHLIYLDSAIPVSGRSPLDLAEPEIAAARRRLGAETGGVSIAPPDPAVFGVPEGPDADWVRRRLTPHPFGTMATALTLAHSPGNGLRAPISPAPTRCMKRSPGRVPWRAPSPAGPGGTLPPGTTPWSPRRVQPPTF